MTKIVKIRNSYSSLKKWKGFFSGFNIFIISTSTVLLNLKTFSQMSSNFPNCVGFVVFVFYFLHVELNIDYL